MLDLYFTSQVHTVQMVLNRAIRIICSLKGRDCSISAVREKLQLKALEDCMLKDRLRLLVRMLSNVHPVLTDLSPSNPRTNPTSFIIYTLFTHTNRPTYFQSFLPRTIKDQREEAAPDG